MSFSRPGPQREIDVATELAVVPAIALPESIAQRRGAGRSDDDFVLEATEPPMQV